MATDPKRELEELLASYIDRLNDGETLDPDLILAEHPLLAGEVLEYLDDYVAVAPNREHADVLGTLGDYTLRRQIGRGGMGVVYEAWQSSLDRRVALKVLPAGVAAENKAFMRFMREAKTAAQLDHENVVGVYGMGVEENTPYYAMQYVEGETLAQILQRVKDAEPEAETPFGPKGSIACFDRLARLFAEVADGLQHAHARGVIHRDVKPSNLILEPEAGKADWTSARLRILDFGLALFEEDESLTFTGDIVGTPLYMSPEQARRRTIPIDHRTDIYSLGATIYEALCGRPPLQGRDHSDTLSQIIERDPIDVRKVNARVPRDLETIVAKCLRKDAGDRYRSAEALAQDLRRFVRSDPVEARPQARWERVLRRMVRFRIPIAVTALIIVSVSVAGLVTYREHRAEQLRRYESGLRAAVADIEFFRSLSGRFTGESVLVQAAEIFSLPGMDDLVPATATDALLETAAEIERLVSLAAERPEARYQLANARYLAGDGETALREIAALLNDRPDFVPAMALRARIRGEGVEALTPKFSSAASAENEVWPRYWLEAHEALARHEWPRARKALDRVLSSVRFDAPPFPGFFLEALKTSGIVRLREGDAYGALEDFRAVRTLWPESPESVLLSGMAYLELGAQEKAALAFDELYDKTLRDRPEYATWVAVVCLNLDRAQAERWYERIPDPFLRARWRAHTLLMHYRFEEAIGAANEALGLRPDDLKTRIYKAEALIHAGHPDRAYTVLESVRTESADDSYTWTIIGFAETRLARYVDAERSFRTALEIRHDDVRAQIQLADVFLCRSEFERAADGYRLAIDANPRTAHARMNLGHTLAILGDTAGAKLALDRSREILPGHPVSAVYASMLAAKEGRVLEALENLALAIEVDLDETGWSPWALTKLGPLFDCRLDGEEARARSETLERLEASVAKGYTDSALLDSLARGWLGVDNARALGLAERAVERSARARAGFLSTFSRALRASGEIDLAVRALEDALRLPDASRALARELETLRRETLPRIASYAMADWASVTGEGDVLEPASVEIARYLEAIQLRRAGKFVAASEILARLAERDASDPAPLLELVDCQIEAGHTAEALAVLRRALEGEAARHREVWETWLVEAFRGGGQGPVALLESFPESKRELDPGAAWRADSRWLLERLAGDRAFGIACGSESDEFDCDAGISDAETWGRDRFALGGRSSQRVPVDPGGSAPVEVYRTARVFTREPVHGGHRLPFPGPFDREEPAAERSSLACGYRIPLPTGRYEVTLHFAALDYEDRERAFDIAIEEKLRERAFRPADGGIDRASVRRFSMDVDDGALDIELLPREGVPEIAGIELRW